MTEDESQEPWDAVRVALWTWRDEFDKELSGVVEDVTTDGSILDLVGSIQLAPKLFQAMREQHLPPDLERDLGDGSDSPLDFDGLDANRLRLLKGGSILRRSLDAELIDYALSQIEGSPESMQIRYESLIVAAHPKRLSSTITEQYIRRAARLLVLGFDVECSVFCRAALESALKFRLSDEELGTTTVRPDRYGNYSLEKLTNAAEELSLFDGKSRERADTIRKRGNQCIHPRDPLASQEIERVASARYALVSLAILLRRLFPASSMDEHV